MTAGRKLEGRLSRPKKLRMAGFTLVSAVFILVVLALLATAIVVVTSLQQRSSALDFGAAQAYQSARAGLEWSAFQVLQAAPGVCFANKNIPMSGQLNGFTATVSCTLFADVDAGVSVNIFRLTANACNIPAGGACPNAGTTSATYVERQLVMTVQR